MTPERPSLPSLDRVTVPGRRPDALLRAPLGPAVTATPLDGVRAGASMAWARLARRPTLLTVALGAALIVVGASIEVHAGSAGAVDRALAGAFRLVIPLVTFALAAEASGRGHLREGLWPLARYGLNRRDLALGVLAVTLAASAAVSALFAIGSVLVAHVPSAPPLLGDLFTSAWIGAFTGLCYAAWFLFGASFGKRGRARWLPLVADVLLGGSTSLIGALLPRANAQNLLGGPAPMHLTQPASSVVLLATAALLALLTALRCRD